MRIYNCVLCGKERKTVYEHECDFSISSKKECITHHFACECREKAFAKMQERVKELEEKLFNIETLYDTYKAADCSYLVGPLQLKHQELEQKLAKAKEVVESIHGVSQDFGVIAFCEIMLKEIWGE